MDLGELFELGTTLEDWLLPWPIDLQLDDLSTQNGLLVDIERARQSLYERSPFARKAEQTL